MKTDKKVCKALASKVYFRCLQFLLLASFSFLLFFKRKKRKAMSPFSGSAEWHYKGTCIWIASFFSIAANALMIFTYLRHSKAYSVGEKCLCRLKFFW